ncbi:MAG TPA: membrane dipeptidase [Candidatus Bathyarchaeota archaeon]|nr:membrane dipeptidase [Candidatus Bathyarchaeota archaeon]
MVLVSMAERIHEEAVVVDAHNDTIITHKRLGMSLNSRTDKTQVDFPRLREAKVDVSFFAVDVTIAFKNYLTYALDAFGFFERELEQAGDEMSIVTTKRSLSEAIKDGKLGVVLAIENSDAVEGSLNVLRMLFKLGVRSIGLTHNPRSLAADGVGESRTGGGLTTFGVQLIEEMNRLGIIVDLAHISEKGFWDALEVSRKPVIVSHGNCKALCNHRRNLTDEQLRGLASKGGVIGVTFVPAFIDEKAPSLSRLLDHIDHIVEVAGIDHVGLGSDFDGGGTLLRDVTELPKITRGLLERGYEEGEVRKILGENFQRVLLEVLPE